MTKILVLDTETTGLTKPHAFEVCAQLCEIQDGKLVPTQTLHQLYNPGKPIEPEASKIHGYTDSMLANLPPIENLQLDRLGITPADTVYIIGHNIKFDIDCLKNTAIGDLAKILSVAIPVCTKKLARNHYDLGSNRLVHIATDVLGLDEELVDSKAHSADFDVQLCIKFANHAMDLLEIKSINALEVASRRLEPNQYEFLKELENTLPEDQDAFDALIVEANLIGLPHISQCAALEFPIIEALQENAFNFANKDAVRDMGDLLMLEAYLHSEEAFAKHASGLGLKPELISDTFKIFHEKLSEFIIGGCTTEDVFIDDDAIKAFSAAVDDKIRHSNWMVRDILQNYVDFCFDWFDGDNYRAA